MLQIINVFLLVLISISGSSTGFFVRDTTFHLTSMRKTNRRNLITFDTEQPQGEGKKHQTDSPSSLTVLTNPKDELTKPRKTRKKKQEGEAAEVKTTDGEERTKSRRTRKKKDEEAAIEVQEKIKKTRAKKEPLEVVLFPPSPEQKTIIDAISMGKSVIVDAVAGSGKTTTVLHIARENPGKNIIQITYNKDLKREVREKVDSLKISNLEIQSYHSLGVRYYDYHCYTDDGIVDILNKNKKPRARNSFDIVIIDETQDMTPNYFALVCKFIKDMKAKDATFLVLGDRYQGIYEFKDADLRFLVYFDRLLTDGEGGVENKFLHLSMQESFRATEQIAWFVNQAMLGEDRLVSRKKGNHKVYYFRQNAFLAQSDLARVISKFVTDYHYKPSDIFILAPSLKGNSANNQLKRLENSLVELKIPVHFARSDEQALNDKILAGKLVFSTFHQSKGRERKVAVVWGFDGSYTKYFNRHKNPDLCPSELYVAATRASEVLILLEQMDDGPLDFLKVGHEELMSSEMTQFIGKAQILDYDDDDNDDDDDVNITIFHITSAVDLTKYLSEANTAKVRDLLAKVFVEIVPPTKEHTINIPSSVNTKDGKVEEVSDINGLVLPAIYEHQTKGYSTLQKNRDKMREHLVDSAKVFFKSVEQAVKVDDDLERFLMMGNEYIALNERIYSKFRQVDSYKWLKKETVYACLENLKRQVSGSAEYELTLGSIPKPGDLPRFRYESNRFGCIEINAVVDCVDKDTLWEFKCVESFSNEHLSQLVVYAWIWEKCMKSEFGSKKFKILNIRTGEVRELHYTNHLIEEIMDTLFENKYSRKIKDDDDEFIRRFKSIREIIWNPRRKKET